MKWFKHDSDANHDAKLRKVRIKYGMEGYGLYWYCLELIVGNIDAHNMTFELEHDAEIIAHDTGIHVERINEMMAFMVNLGLFESKNKSITCLKLAKRLDQSMTSNPAMREKIKGIAKLLPDKHFLDSHDGVMIESCQSHDTIMQEEIRRDKKRIDKKKRFVPPTLAEVAEYAKEKNSRVDPAYFHEYYKTSGWQDKGGAKVKNWKQKFLTWHRREEQSKTRRTNADGQPKVAL